MSGLYNLRNPAVKRLMKEAQELRDSTEQYYAQPLEDNLFEWHFTIRGPQDSEFKDGLYHGRIILPPEYPMKPPSIMLLTPNGRFEIFKKICLSISGHHPESWQPSWSIRTALLAIIGFMPTHGNGAIGSLDYTPEERKVLAKRTLDWKCSECGSIKNLLKPVTEASKETQREAKELASQMNFQSEKERDAAKKKTGEEDKSKSNQTAPSPSAAAGASAPASPLAPDPSGAAAATSSSQSSPQTPPFSSNYPQFPNMNLPPFMQMPMVPPQGNQTPRFIPPFWMPGMVPPTSPMTSSNVMPNQQWPPMMPPMMMPPNMMQFMNQQHLLQQPQPTTPMVESLNPTQNASISGANSVSTSPNPITSNTNTTSTSSISNTSPSTSASTSSTSTSSTSPSTSSTSTASTSTSTPVTSSPTTQPLSSPPTPSEISATTTSPTTTSATPITTSSGLRHRTTPAPGWRPVSSPAPTTLEPQATPRRGENPMLILMMAILGLAIVALLLRRLYSMWENAPFDEY